MKHAVLLLLLLLAATSPSAQACRCRQPPPPKEAMENSLGVFAGKVTAVQRDGGILIVTMSVSQTWKGTVEKEITIRTAGNSAACGFNFKIDEEYLVYCSGEKDGVWATNLCTRTKNLVSAKDDLEALGPGKMPAP